MSGYHWKLVLTILAIGLGPVVVRATEDDGEPPPPAEVQGEDGFMMDESNFDQWVFQGSGNATAGRAKLNSHLKLKLDEVTRVCNLTESQQRKLTVAARGDMKRYFDRVEEIRKKFQAVKNDRNGFNQIWQDIQPLQQKLSMGLFGESSLFAKTLQKTLTEEQQAKYQALMLERRRYRYRAAIEVSLMTLSNSTGLRHAQHEALLKMLLEETQPPKAFGQYDEQIVMYALSKLPAAKVKALVDDRQWKLMQVHLNQGRGMEAFLAQNGFIDGNKGAVAAEGIMGAVGAIFGVAQPVQVLDVQVDAVAIEAVEAQPVEVQEEPPADALKPERPARKGKK